MRILGRARLRSISIDAKPGPYGGYIEFIDKENSMDEEAFIEKAKRLVRDQYNNSGIGTPRGARIDPLGEDDVYVVWFVKALQNWKAMVSTTRDDGRYYEVTYDGDNAVAYVDSYRKTHNIAVPD